MSRRFAVVGVVGVAYIACMMKSAESAASGRNERRFRHVRSPAARTALRNKAERRRAMLTPAQPQIRAEAQLLDEIAEAVAAKLRAEWDAQTSKRLRTSADDYIEAAQASPASFSAGPRARALLRGREIAEKDLTESGGSYSLEEARRLLNGVSRQAVEKRVREGRLLAVVGHNNRRFYPVAQFNDDGSVIDGLRAVQDALATRNAYAVLNFLVNPNPRLDNRKPISLLKQGEVEQVVEVAARIGEQGA